MESGSSNSCYIQTCICYRSFSHPAAFKNHQNSCAISKRILSNALTLNKARIAARKARTHQLATELSDNPLELQDYAIEDSETSRNSETLLATSSACLEQVEISRPTKRRRILPKHLQASGLTMHDRRLQSFLPLAAPDILPEPLLGLPSNDEQLQPIQLNAGNLCEIPRPASCSEHLGPQFIDSLANSFGLFRRYHSSKLPTHDPEIEISLAILLNGSDPQTSHSIHLTTSDDGSKFYPYPNETSFLLGEWFWNSGGQKSQENFKKLLEIVGSNKFSPTDIQQTNWNKVNNQLAINDWDTGEWVDEDAGWHRSSVTINVPFYSEKAGPRSKDRIGGPQEYIVHNFYHRQIISVIRERLIKDAQSKHHFHFDPFELLWNRDSTTENPVRLQGELYTSPAFIEAHRELQASPGEPGCDLQRVVVALMFWSDATHLTNFGNAKLWPLYMLFGNDSKYERCKPSSNLCEHLAYFEQLPDEFKDFASKYTKKNKIGAHLLAHCHRELTHAQWKLLLDDEFLYVYEHGLVVECGDGLRRRFYPRIFSYSADYPEKVLMTTIRNKGGCPCPRCKIPLSETHLIGSKRDRKKRVSKRRIDDQNRRNAILVARKAIYEVHCSITGTVVEAQLKEHSLVPTSNAFSDSLSKFGFDFFSIFHVDLMHEVELGVWRNLLIHLLRILQSAGEYLLHELDQRFRLIPTFGRDTIRRFSRNSSELKKMAAWNYEDFLQCAIPVFEGLLPEPHNSQIRNLLFHLAYWHGLAKLRLHSDDTLKLLDDETTKLGEHLRKFQSTTCAAFQTKELSKEANARHRRQAKQNSKPGKKATRNSTAPGNIADQAPQRKPKVFNLNTYKTHALGDYVATIRQYGTTDSYSTELGELEHRTPKGRYKRTSKKGYKQQLAQIERRQARIQRIRVRLSARENTRSDSMNDLSLHHHIGVSENCPKHIGTFLRSHLEDPASKNFFSKLKSHLAPRLKILLQMEHQAATTLSTPTIESFEIDPNTMYFNKDYMYQHNLFRINYTTYDVRRGQDAINPKTDHCDIMLLSNPLYEQYLGSEHQFRYARVLGIYHINLIYTGPGKIGNRPRRMEFLWVRWFEDIYGKPVQYGWTNQVLDQVQFQRIDEENAFGFVNPADVLRGCHLIQKFSFGRVHCDGKGLSESANDGNDWRVYYVNRFVDRDMVMRYHWRLGIGHMYTRANHNIPELDVSPRPRPSTSHATPNHPHQAPESDIPQSDASDDEPDTASASQSLTLQIGIPDSNTLEEANTSSSEDDLDFESDQDNVQDADSDTDSSGMSSDESQGYGEFEDEAEIDLAMYSETFSYN